MKKNKLLLGIFVGMIVLSGCIVNPPIAFCSQSNKEYIKDEKTTFADNPQYAEYLQAAKKKIFYYASKNYRYLEEGTVKLGFRIRRDGKVMIVEVSKSSPSKSRNLTNIAIKAVKQASPFAPFTGPLANNPYLDVTVDIEFVIKK